MNDKLHRQILNSFMVWAKINHPNDCLMLFIKEGTNYWFHTSVGLTRNYESDLLDPMEYTTIDIIDLEIYINKNGLNNLDIWFNDLLGRLNKRKNLP